MVSDPGDADVQRRVLRARIGVRWPASTSRHELQDRLADAITTAVAAVDGTVDLLQVDLAANPTWSAHGPVDRVTDNRLDQPDADEAPPVASSSVNTEASSARDETSPNAGRQPRRVTRPAGPHPY